MTAILTKLSSIILSREIHLDRRALLVHSKSETIISVRFWKIYLPTSGELRDATFLHTTLWYCSDRHCHKRVNNPPPQRNERRTANKGRPNQYEMAGETGNNLSRPEQANREQQVDPVHQPIKTKEKDYIIAHQLVYRIV